MQIISVHENSPADVAGIRAGDCLIAIDGFTIHDHIDILFHGSEDVAELTLKRNGLLFTVVMDGYDWGIEFEDMQYKSCGNRCLFCFVDQNPGGMRPEIYFKDEDYRLSFLHGSYVTLTAVTNNDIRRIEEQRLSPLYVSVHATDPEIRRKLLGIRRDDHLMAKIDRLINSGITLHTQAVICPGINDGDMLDRTMRELGSRYPGVASLAVVPVGLTKHRSKLPELQPADAGLACEIIRQVDSYRAERQMKHEDGFVYCADEWYIKAGLEIPGDIYYGDYSQFENGVGMVRRFMDMLEFLEESGIPDLPAGRYVFVTGQSMAPYIDKFAHILSSSHGVNVETVAVSNNFYGESVTVSGLLTGRDIIGSLNGVSLKTIVVLPPNCLNDNGYFLDGMTPADITQTLDVLVVQGEYDPAETVKILESLTERCI